MMIFKVYQLVLMNCLLPTWISNFSLASRAPKIFKKFEKNKLGNVVESSKKVPVYNSFQSTFAEMEASVEIEDIGITVLVGPSKAAAGRGLFVCLNEDVESVTLPRFY